MNHSTQSFWQPWRRHWLFVSLLIVLGPIVGYAINDDRGLLFGAAVGVFAALWLSWSDHERHRIP